MVPAIEVYAKKKINPKSVRCPPLMSNADSLRVLTSRTHRESHGRNAPKRLG